MSIPTLLDQSFFPIESLNADEEEEDVVQPTNISKPGDDTETSTDNNKIHQRILILETENEKSNKSATVLSLHQLSQEKLKQSDLENRIEELESALELEESVEEEDSSISTTATATADSCGSE